MAKFRTMKVFNWLDMPKALQNIFSNLMDEMGKRRGIVEYYINHSIDMDKNDIKVQEWLISNGAEGIINSDEEGETVLIEYDW